MWKITPGLCCAIQSENRDRAIDSLDRVTSQLAAVFAQKEEVRHFNQTEWILPLFLHRFNR
jgi:hypothetical protein